MAPLVTASANTCASFMVPTPCELRSAIAAVSTMAHAMLATSNNISSARALTPLLGGLVADCIALPEEESQLDRLGRETEPAAPAKINELLAIMRPEARSA